MPRLKHTDIASAKEVSAAQGAYKLPALRVLSEITSSLSSDNNLEDLLETWE